MPPLEHVPPVHRRSASTKRRANRTTSPRRRQRSNDGTFVEASEEAALNQDLHSAAEFVSFDSSACESPYEDDSADEEDPFLTPE